MSNNYDYKLDVESKNSLSVILSKIHPQSRVLEFGPASGRMTRYLKEILKCQIYGVEIDKDAATLCSPYMENLLIEDINTLGWLESFRHISFDVIIFADVLEHLSDPLNILAHAATLLGEEGVIYISIPNITHNSIIMELFKEKFTYSSAGLLDSTHIHFFSYNSFKELIEKSSLSIAFEDTIIVPPGLSEFTHLYEDFSPCMSDFLEKREYGEVYQFIFGLKHHTIPKEVTPALINKKPKRYAQLFVDCGEGYGEHIEDLFIENCGLNACIEFDISHYKNILGLRFDPLNRCAIVSLHNIVLISTDGNTTTLGHSISNAIFTYKGEDYFTTYDPIYHFDLPNQLIVDGKTIKIMISYKEDSYVNILKKIIDCKEAIINEKEKIINEKEEVINKLNLLWSVKLSSKLSRFFNFSTNRNSYK